MEDGSARVFGCRQFAKQKKHNAYRRAVARPCNIVVCDPRSVENS
jgi:hypothetical protein